MKITNDKGKIDIPYTINWYLKEIIKHLFNLIEPDGNMYERGLQIGYKNGLSDAKLMIDKEMNK
jgi:hypothetical protein